MKLSRILPALAFLSTVVFTGSVIASAQSAEGFKADLSHGKEGCVASINTLPDLAQAKKYGNDRITARLASVDKLDKATDKFYRKRAETYNDALDKVQITNSRYTNGKTIKSNLPADHKKDIDGQIKARKKMLDSYNAQLGQAADVASVANVTCSAIFEARIYSGLTAKAKQQMKVDRLTMRNAINQARYTASDNIYDQNKSKDQVKKVRSAVSGMPKPSENVTGPDGLNAAQATLDKDKSAEELIKKLEDIIVDKQAPEINEGYKKVAKATNEANKAIAAAQARARAQAQSNSSAGGSGSSGSTGSKGPKRTHHDSNKKEGTRKNRGNNDNKRPGYSDSARKWQAVYNACMNGGGVKGSVRERARICTTVANGA